MFIHTNPPLTPLRQAHENYVCVNLLRKRNISINYYLDTFFNLNYNKKIKSLKVWPFYYKIQVKNSNLDIKIFFYKIN